MEYRNGHAEVRRSRRLVLSFVATVVNYEYCFYWHFYQVGGRPDRLQPVQLAASPACVFSAGLCAPVHELHPMKEPVFLLLAFFLNSSDVTASLCRMAPLSTRSN